MCVCVCVWGGGGGGGGCSLSKIFNRGALSPLKLASIVLRLMTCEEHVHFTRRVNNSLEG